MPQQSLHTYNLSAEHVTGLYLEQSESVSRDCLSVQVIYQMNHCPLSETLILFSCLYIILFTYEVPFGPESQTCSHMCCLLTV